MPQSQLQLYPKSVIRERGYINVYSDLTEQERRQLAYTRKNKQLHPDWDSTTVLECIFFQQSLDAFLQHNPNSSGPAVLDAGCGRGNYVIDEFRTKIAWAAGVDVDASATEGNVCLDEIRFASLEHIPYDNASFDIVTCFWVLEHIANPEKVFYDIARVLKPEGVFIFATPNKYSAIVQLKRFLHSSLVNALNHRLYGREHGDVFPTLYRANDLRTLRRLCNDAGFTTSHMQRNYDPIYTSFNSTSFRFSETFDAVCSAIAPTLSKPHLVGWAKKT